MCVRAYIEQKLLFRWSILHQAWMHEDLYFAPEFWPGNTSPVLIQNGKREITNAQWGIVPPWAKHPKTKQPDPNWGKKNAYNARSETIFDKTTFKTAIRKRRCIVPVTGFYEQLEKRWYRFVAKDGVMAIAGIFEEPNDLCPIRSFAMVTTDPNPQIADYQDRMPVILAPENIETWLNPDADPYDLTDLFRPCPEDWTRVEDAGPVGRAAIIPEKLFD